MLADVKFFDLLINIQTTQAEIIAHCGNIQLLILECKLLSVILIDAQLMQPFSALSATQSRIFLTKRTSFLGNGFEVVIASVEPIALLGGGVVPPRRFLGQSTFTRTLAISLRN